MSMKDWPWHRPHVDDIQQEILGRALSGGKSMMTADAHNAPLIGKVEMAPGVVIIKDTPPDRRLATQADLKRIEDKLDSLIKALKAHGLGAWTE